MFYFEGEFNVAYRFFVKIKIRYMSWMFLITLQTNVKFKIVPELTIIS